MTRLDLNALRKLAEAATPGPWRSELMSHYERRGWRKILAGKAGVVRAASYNLATTNPFNDERETETHCGVAISAEDAAFIEAANPAVILALIERLETTQCELRRLQDRLLNDQT